jgi:hypothetical protein
MPYPTLPPPSPLLPSPPLPLSHLLSFPPSPTLLSPTLAHLLSSPPSPCLSKIMILVKRSIHCRLINPSPVNKYFVSNKQKFKIFIQNFIVQKFIILLK